SLQNNCCDGVLSAPLGCKARAARLWLNVKKCFKAVWVIPTALARGRGALAVAASARSDASLCGPRCALWHQHFNNAVGSDTDLAGAGFDLGCRHAVHGCHRHAAHHRLVATAAEVEVDDAVIASAQCFSGQLCSGAKGGDGVFE